MIRAALCLALPLVLLGCDERLDLNTRETARVAGAEYPTLAPLPELLASSQGESQAKPAEAELAGRASGLRARANALRNRSTD